MNRNDYKGQIEKTAASNASEKSLPANVRDSYIEMKVNDAKKGLIKGTGALIGTGLALKGGAPIGKAITSGGIGGMAIGDIAGSAVIPTMSLYKKHKQEFGTAPDMKTTGKLMAANVLPTAGFWGAAYGTKAGLKYRNGIASGAQSAINGIKARAGGISDILDNAQDMIPPNVARDAKGRPILTPEQNKELNREVFQKVKKVMVGDEFSDLSGDGVKGIARKVGKGALMAAGSGVAMEAINIPAAYATPTNLINAKKKRLEQGQNTNG